jgi:hypothetical protein
LNETPDKIYILLRGELLLETELEIEEQNKFPIVSLNAKLTAIGNGSLATLNKKKESTF